MEPIKGKELSAEVRPYQGKPGLYINGKPVYPMFYSLTDCPGGCWSWESLPQSSLKRFADTGVRLFQVDLFMEHVWPEEDVFDITPMQKQVQGVLKICPEAAVVVRLHVNAPRWWMDLHPEESVQYAGVTLREENTFPAVRRIIDDDLEPVQRNSMASDLWRETMSQKLARFCEEFSKTEEGNSLIGIHLACGVFGEWHYWGFFDYLPDVSQHMTEHFRRFLKERYQTDHALQKAWGQPEAALCDAKVPEAALRERTLDGIFRDPIQERQVIDYFECQHMCIVDRIEEFSKIVKDHWPRKLLTGVFYGYYFSMFDRMANGGHLEPERLLSSPYVDYLSAPQAYYENFRDMGECGISRGMLDSCRLHGKLFLDEMDQATCLDQLRTERGFKDRNPTISDTISIVRRNVFSSYLKGMGLWFYDFGPTNVCGWWDDPEILEDIHALHTLLAERYDLPLRELAQVLLVYDTKSFYHLASTPGQDPITDVMAVNRSSSEAYRAGAMIETVYFSDLEKMDFSRFKVVIFCNTCRMTQAQKRLVKEKIACEGRHLVWFGPAGYTDGKENRDEFVQECTGIRLVRTPLTEPPQIQTNEGELFGAGKEYAPFFTVDDSEAETLGYHCQTGKPAFVRKKQDGYTAWYASLPLNKRQLFQTIFRQAGVHLYSLQGDVYYDTGNLLMIHTKDGGKRQVLLQNQTQIDLELPPRSTTFYDAKTGERML